VGLNLEDLLTGKVRPEHPDDERTSTSRLTSDAGESSPEAQGGLRGKQAAHAVCGIEAVNPHAAREGYFVRAALKQKWS